ncbi:MAG TPA: hypothetical protein VGK97_10300 [Spongiibacteraceae bacterium]|jgi:hypothetical protein
MAVKNFTHKPKNTFGVTVESTVQYDCLNKPAIVGNRMVGFTRFGFIISYEDKIDAFVHRAKLLPCAQDDCARAVKYEFEIKYFVACEIGIGINIGKLGTGTFGFPIRSVEEIASFSTGCECCDGELEQQRNFQLLLQPRESEYQRNNALPLLLALAAVTGAAAMAINHFSDPGKGAETFVGLLLAAVAASGVVTWVRYRKLIGAKNKSYEHLDK